MAENVWDERYAGDEYRFGTQPNAFLAAQQGLLRKGMRCLALADGEGRNSVWLAEQGLDVVAVDSSKVALAKAKELAQQRGVAVQFELADLLCWDAPENQFDVLVAIFIQFTSWQISEAMFAKMKRSLKPNGLLLLQGYTARQLEFHTAGHTGGPKQIENLYTEPLLRAAFADMQILQLHEHDEWLAEGVGHSGMSALIDVVARKI